MLPLYTLTVFWCAFLLFVVQPMYARMVLPLLGASPAVWNTAMVFYQGTLLLGYGYAHVACRRLGVRRQTVLHVLLMGAALFALPMALPESGMPPAESSPIPWLLAAMAMGMGLPFFLVTSGSPLLQRWFAETSHPHARDPYFLYAAGNIGSLSALLAYPTLIEPHMPLTQQADAWAASYAILIVLMAGCGIAAYRGSGAAGAAAAERTPRSGMAALRPRQGMYWAALAFVPSSLMLSVTQYMTTDLASAPMLWVVPLSLYLGTFALAFARRPWLPHEGLKKAAPMAIVAWALVLAMRGTDPLALVMSFHLLAFFIVAMTCHGELARSRPPAEDLTAFYLWIAAGGVLGGAFNSILAPWMFDDLIEYPLMLCFACLLLRWPPAPGNPARRRVLDIALPAALGVAMAGAVLGLQSGSWIPAPANNLLMFAAPAVVCFSFSRRPVRMALGLAAFFAAASLYHGSTGQVAHTERSFFGITRVSVDPSGRFRQVLHGNTVHGRQALDPARQDEPLAYFGRGGPLGRFLTGVMESRPIRRVGVVGLGAGVTSVYAQPGQDWTFFEIDPVVIRTARDPTAFTFLARCKANVRIVPGDARISLMDAPDDAFDILLLDAYGSDSAPVHLLTREAMALYLRVVADNGVIVFQISNRYMDLESVVAAAAKDAGVACRVWSHSPSPEERDAGWLDAKYAFVARSDALLDAALPDADWRDARILQGAQVWTDDYAALLPVLLWWGRSR